MYYREKIIEQTTNLFFDITSQYDDHEGSKHCQEPKCCVAQGKDSCEEAEKATPGDHVNIGSVIENRRSKKTHQSVHQELLKTVTIDTTFKDFNGQSAIHTNFWKQRETFGIEAGHLARRASASGRTKSSAKEITVTNG